MTTPAEVKAWVDEITNQNVLLAGQIDALQVLQISYEAQIKSMQADFDAYKASHPDAIIPPFTLVEFSDFAQSPTCGRALGSGSLRGAGLDRVTYRMKPNTSTKASTIAAIVKGQSNPYRLMAAGGSGTPSIVNAQEITGFTLLGTDQGHMYGGLRVAYSNGLHIHDILVKGIPGNAAGPPGETFSVGTYRCDQALLERVRIDGRNTLGSPVAATLIGINSSVNTVVRNCIANYAAAGMAIAVWDSTNTDIVDFDARYCRHPINFEQPHPGLINLVRCDMRGQTDAGPNITVNSNIGSSKVVITDPVVDKWPLRVGVSSAPYISKPQLQKVSDVQLILAGKDVSSDPTKLACGQVW